MRITLFAIGVMLSVLTCVLFLVATSGSMLSLALLLAFHTAMIYHLIIAPWLLFIIRDQGRSALNLVIVVYLLVVFTVGGYGVYQIYVSQPETGLFLEREANEDSGMALRIQARQLLVDEVRGRPEDEVVLAKALALVLGGAPVNVKDDRLEPAIWYAASAGSLELVNALLDAGAIVDDETIFPRSPLLEAVSKQHGAVVDRLLDAGANPNAMDGQGITPLIAAARNGDLAMARKLLAQGANPKSESSVGGTAVLAALEQKRADILQVLLERGAKVILPDWDFKLPMQIALENDDFASVDVLRKYSHGFEAQTPALPPVMFWVFEKCDLVLFKRLLEMGADPNIRLVSTGQTLFHRILRSRDATCGDGTRRNAFLIALIDANVDLNLKNKEGESLLLIALYENNAEIARLLISRGAELAGRNRLDRDILHLAARHGLDDIVQIALAAQFDINRRSTSRNGTTPLEEAIASHHAATVSLLIESGATFPLEVPALQALYRNAGGDLATLQVVLREYLKGPRDSKSDRLFYVWVERANNLAALEMLQQAGVQR